MKVTIVTFSTKKVCFYCIASANFDIANQRKRKIKNTINDTNRYNTTLYDGNPCSFLEHFLKKVFVHKNWCTYIPPFVYFVNPANKGRYNVYKKNKTRHLDQMRTGKH